MPRSCTRQYRQRLAVLNTRIDDLRAQLDRHATEQQVDCNNRGFIGDIEHAIEQVDDLVRTFKGDDSEPYSRKE